MDHDIGCARVRGRGGGVEGGGFAANEWGGESDANVKAVGRQGRLQHA